MAVPNRYILHKGSAIKGLLKTAARAAKQRLPGGELARSGQRIKALAVKFTRPFTLPAEVGVYLDGRARYVAKAPGTRAYLVGFFGKKTRV